MSDKKDKEFSESGAPIYRYEDKEFEFQAPEEIDTHAKELFETHIEKYIGPINMVFHEVLSHLVHIDVYHISPTDDRPFHTLITHGMSDKAMNVPEGLEEFQYTELMCFLPPETDVSENGFKDFKNYWAVENLKFLARFPHEYNTWLGFGHTIQNGDPIEPFLKETKLCASLIVPPILLHEEFSVFESENNKTIHIYNVFPIYKEEMDFKMKNGAEELLEKFDEYELTDIYDIHRVNTCKKGFFGLKW